MPKRSRPVIQIVGVVALYWCVSISMIFANKHLVGGRFSEIDVSIFVAWVQCLISVLMAVVITWARRVFFGHDVSLPPINMKVIRNKDFIMVIFMFTGMLAFNNLCLKHVGVAFFQVARSMTLIFTVILSAIFLSKRASCRVILCCVVVAAGFVLGVDQEHLSGTLSVRGVVYGIITSLFVSMNGIFIKRLLDFVKNSSIATVYYMNSGACVLFIPLLIGTGQLWLAITEKATEPVFLGLLILSGILSFFIGFASNLQIDFTSPVTHHISNNAKSVFQTLIAVLALRLTKSLLWWGSNFMVIGGALFYTMIRMREEKEAKEKAAAAEAGEKDVEMQNSESRT